MLLEIRFLDGLSVQPVVVGPLDQNQIVRRIVFLVSINVMKLKAISDMFGKPRCGAFRMGI